MKDAVELAYGVISISSLARAEGMSAIFLELLALLFFL